QSGPAGHCRRTYPARASRNRRVREVLGRDQSEVHDPDDAGHGVWRGRPEARHAAGPMTDPQAATAYHEAGHAVAALTLGRPVAWVSVRPDRQFLGMYAFGKAVFRPSEDWIEREAIIALA